MQLGLGLDLSFNYPKIRRKKEQKGTPIRNGLVAEYLFDEGRGQVLCDYSGNGNHGQLGSTREADTNDPLWTPQGLEFDGVDDYVDIFDAPEFINMSAEICIKPLEDIYPKANWFGNATGRGGWMFYRNNAVYVGNGEVWVAVALFPAVNVGELVHLCFTYDGTVGADEYSLRVYKNGELKDAVKCKKDASRVITSPINVRLDNFESSWFWGHTKMLVPLVRIYSRALSPEEVLQNYEWSKTELAKRGVIFE